VKTKQLSTTALPAPTMATFGAPAPATGQNASAAPQDHNVAQAGNDGISSLTWSPTSNILVSSNWDGGVRCWEAQESAGQIRALPKAQGKDGHESRSADKLTGRHEIPTEKRCSVADAAPW